MINRILIHLKDENADNNLIEEYINIVKDRVRLRLGTSSIPSLFNSIIVEVVIKMYRRQYFEGVESETVGGENIKFVTDLLEEYEAEFKSYLYAKKDEEYIEAGINKVRFI